MKPTKEDIKVQQYLAGLDPKSPNADIRRGNKEGPLQAGDKLEPMEPELPELDLGEEGPISAYEQYIKTMEQIESKGDPLAASKSSSAKGPYQFIEETWYGEKPGDHHSYAHDPQKAREALDSFTAKNAKQLKSKLGRDPEPQELYMAHNLGAGGALKLLKADPDASVESVITKEAADKNPSLYKKDGKYLTVSEAIDNVTANYNKKQEELFGKQAKPVAPTAAWAQPQRQGQDFGKPEESTTQSVAPKRPQAAERNIWSDLSDIFNPQFADAEVKEPSADQRLDSQAPAFAQKERMQQDSAEEAPTGSGAGFTPPTDADTTRTTGVQPEEDEPDNQEKEVSKVAQKLQEIEEYRLQMPEAQRTDFDSIVKKVYADYKRDIAEMNRTEAFTALGLALAQLAAVAYAGSKGADLTGVQLMTQFPSWQNQREQASRDFRTELEDVRGQQSREDRLIKEDQQAAKEDFEFRRGLKVDELKELMRREREDERRKYDEERRIAEQEARAEEKRKDRLWRSYQNQLDRELRTTLAGAKSSQQDKKATALQQALRLSDEFELAEANGDDRKAGQLWEKMRQQLVLAGRPELLENTIGTEPTWFGLSEEAVAKPLDKSAVARPTTQADPEVEAKYQRYLELKKKLGK